MRKGCLWGVGGIVLLTALGVIFVPRPQPDEATLPKGEAPAAAQAVAVSAEGLGRAFDDNELKAKKDYPGPLLVTGTVSRIESVLGKPSVRFESSRLMSASFEASQEAGLEKLKAGQRISVRCTSLKESISILYLDGCVLN